MKFASDTSVSVAKTRGEIEELVTRSGASQFFSGADEGRAFIGFVMRCNEKKCPDCSSIGGKPAVKRQYECDLCQRSGKVHDKRNVMFELPLPKVEAFKLDGLRRTRSPEKQHAAWEQGCRSSWRALLLAIKAKLVSVESGVESFEEAFLAQLVVKDDEGRNVRFGTRAVQAIANAYTRNGPPQLLLGSGS
jgi:hypothetical protein